MTVSIYDTKQRHVPDRAIHRLRRKALALNQIDKAICDLLIRCSVIMCTFLVLVTT